MFSEFIIFIDHLSLQSTLSFPPLPTIVSNPSDIPKNCRLTEDSKIIDSIKTSTIASAPPKKYPFLEDGETANMENFRPWTEILREVLPGMKMDRLSARAWRFLKLYSVPKVYLGVKNTASIPSRLVPSFLSYMSNALPDSFGEFKSAHQQLSPLAPTSSNNCEIKKSKEKEMGCPIRPDVHSTPWPDLLRAKYPNYRAPQITADVRKFLIQHEFPIMYGTCTNKSKKVARCIPNDQKAIFIEFMEMHCLGALGNPIDISDMQLELPSLKRKDCESGYKPEKKRVLLSGGEGKYDFNELVEYACWELGKMKELSNRC
ncbi:hypothetical protein BDR26DRAFT_867008 [Obelidium mucronatum]|nr:hypothetical protein BDR26DRAFT_867008 [Obelidium mucronatum]